MEAKDFVANQRGMHGRCFRIGVVLVEFWLRTICTIILRALSKDLILYLRILNFLFIKVAPQQ